LIKGLVPEQRDQDPAGEITMATGWEAYQFLLGEWEGGHEGATGCFIVYLEGTSRRLKSK
jgi:hypothetical protein